MKTTPIILAIGGHDPSGGAGLQADIETCMALDCHCICLATCLTRQDSQNVVSIYPQRSADFAAQLETLLADIQPTLVKIGLIGDPALVPIIQQCLKTLNIPLVLDPVLAAGGGTKLASDLLIKEISEHLLPLSTLVTPNRAEARRLSDRASNDAAGRRLLEMGAAAVLITGADEAKGDQVSNNLYRHDQPAKSWQWPLLPHSYHGSGCTLASACTCGLAQGLALEQALAQAQQFTWNSLNKAIKPGKGQYLPMRNKP